MPWIDVGTDEPKWTDDSTLVAGPDTREGFVLPPHPENVTNPLQPHRPIPTDAKTLMSLGVPQYLAEQFEANPDDGALFNQVYAYPQVQALGARTDSGLTGFLERNAGALYMAGMGGAAAFGAGAGAGTVAPTGGESLLGGLGEEVGANAYFANAPVAGGGGVGALAAGTAAAAPVMGTPEWDMTQGFPAPAGLPPQAPDWMKGIGDVAGGAAAGSALSRIIDGPASVADWVQVLGTAGATGLGVYGASKTADRLSDLQNQFRSDRAPFLSAGTNYLDPNKWIEGPGQAFTKGTLQGLSATYGNPISSPTAMGIATDASMRNWISGVNTLGSLGLGGEGIQANLGAGAAQTQGDIYGILGRGIGDIANPQRSLADLLREFRTVVA